MAQYNAVSPVSRFSLSGNKFIDAMFPSQAAMRVAWSTKVDGITQVSYSFPWMDGAASQFTANYARGENRAAVTGGVTTAQAEQIAKVRIPTMARIYSDLMPRSVPI